MQLLISLSFTELAAEISCAEHSHNTCVADVIADSPARFKALVARRKVIHPDWHDRVKALKGDTTRVEGVGLNFINTFCLRVRKLSWP